MKTDASGFPENVRRPGIPNPAIIVFENLMKVQRELGTVRKERDALANVLAQSRHAQQSAAQLAASDVARQLTVTEAVNEALGVVARERDALKSDLNIITVKSQLEEKAIKEHFALQLRDREGEIERLRDMKSHLSTKLVGETLEQHCKIEFTFATRTTPCASSIRYASGVIRPHAVNNSAGSNAETHPPAAPARPAQTRCR